MRRSLLLLIAILFTATAAVAQGPTPTSTAPLPTPTATPTTFPTAVPTPTVVPTMAPVVNTNTVFQPQNPSIAVGSTVQLTGIEFYSDGSMQSATDVTWSSSAPSIATVSASGLVTGVAAGQATITATTPHGSFPVTVTVVSE